MYAIVDVKDKQFKVQENDTLYVPYHSDAEIDDTLTFDRVLLLSDGEGDVTLGTPTVEDASVTARVVDQVKGDKILVFKKKRRKRYRVKRGHRQQYTQIEIEALHTGNGAPADEAEADEAADESDEDVPAESEASEEAEATAEASAAEETEAEEAESDETDAEEPTAEETVDEEASEEEAAEREN